MAFSPKNLFLIVFALGVLAVLVFISPGGFIPRDESGISGGGASSLANLPEGKQEFTIASAEGARPRFVSAVIDPLKVSIGDTQKMKVVLHDEAEVVSVAAEIETDGGVITVPLRLTGTSAFSRAELMNQKYIVREGGVLAINDKISGSPTSGGSRTSQILGVETAEAQDLQKFTFEGEWVVRDTSVKTYRTKFVAKDAEGRENSITMAWSDPCSGVSDGVTGSEVRTLSSACTIPVNTVDGIDNANLTVATSVTLAGSGSKFVWNSGKTLTIGAGGSVIIGADAELRQTYLWAIDADADGYSSSTTWIYGDSACPGCARRYVSGALGVEDCNDLNANVHPFQGSYFAVATTTNSPTPDAVNFDYNCDELEAKDRLSYTSDPCWCFESQGVCEGIAAGTCQTALTPACGVGYSAVVPENTQDPDGALCQPAPPGLNCYGVSGIFPTVGCN